MTRRTVAGGPVFGGFVAVYPNDFPDAEALAPGTYKVEWHLPGEAPPGTAPLLAALVASSTAGPLVASDSFTFPGTQGTTESAS